MAHSFEPAVATGAQASRPTDSSSTPTPPSRPREAALTSTPVLIAVTVFVFMVVLFGYGFYRQSLRDGQQTDGTNAALQATSTAQATMAATGPTAPSSSRPNELPDTPVTIPPGSPGSATAMASPLDTIHADVYFDFGKSRLRADAVETLQRHARDISREPRVAVLIQAYADQHGPAGYNRELARRRGESVKQFLTELGIPGTAIQVLSVGHDVALCDDASPACQRLNRRVHLEIVTLPPPAAPPSPETGTSTGDTQAVVPAANGGE